ncbi:KxYKxGKxW signal peptide domain-containing protein, partial [Limosilactobacillus fermentum]
PQGINLHKIFYTPGSIMGEKKQHYKLYKSGK